MLPRVVLEARSENAPKTNHRFKTSNSELEALRNYTQKGWVIQSHSPWGQCADAALHAGIEFLVLRWTIVRPAVGQTGPLSCTHVPMT